LSTFDLIKNKADGIDAGSNISLQGQEATQMVSEPDHTTITNVHQLNDLALTDPSPYLLRFASLGLPLLPIKPATSTQELHPYVTFDKGTTDSTQIMAWYRQYEGCWWGILTGERSGITVIDVDRHNSQDGFKTLEEKGLTLISTMRQRTPHDGIHYIYKYNSQLPNKNNIDIGIDVRNDNGFILIAPTTKENGKTYEFLDFIFEIDGLPDVPEAFVKTYFPKKYKEKKNKSRKSGKQTQPSGVPPCIAHLTTNGVPCNAGVNYNDANLLLATFAKGQNMPKEEALQLSLQMARNTPQNHETNKKTVNAKHANFQSVYVVVLNDEKYDFSCASVRKHEPLKEVCQQSECELKDFYPRFSHPFFVSELLERYGEKILYCPQLGWLWYDGKRWKTNSKEKVKKALIRSINQLQRDKKPTDEANRDLKQLARERSVPAADIAAEHKEHNERLTKAIRSALNNYNLEAVLKLAQSFDSIIIQYDQLDQHSFLFNCDDGTLNLKTGQLQPFNREDYITKICKVSYRKDAHSKVFSEYLDQRLPAKDVRDFLQKFLGYSLTDETSEELLAFLYGDSRSGKSTLSSSFFALLGDYAGVISRNLLMKGNDDKKLQIMASARGKRFLMCDEVKESDVFDEAFLKTTVSGEPQLARYLYQEPFTYFPTWKIAVTGNTFPKVRDSTEASWRRLGIIPFEKPLNEDEVDPGVKRKFKTDKDVQEAILAWVVEGCFKWQREGIKAPDKVREEKVIQKIENNPIYDFVLRRLQIVREVDRIEDVVSYDLIDTDTSFAEIYKEYELEHQQYAKGRYKIPKPTFANHLKALGFTKATASGKRIPYYENVALVHDDLDLETTAIAISIFQHCLEKNETIKKLKQIENSLFLLQSSPHGKEDKIEEIKAKENDKGSIENQAIDKTPERTKSEVQNSALFCKKVNYVLVNEDNCEEVLQEILKVDKIGLDCETTGLDPLRDEIRLVQIAAGDTAYIFDLFTCSPTTSIKANLSKILTSPMLKIGHNVGFDVKFLKRAGIDVTGPFFDTFLAHKLLYSRDRAALNDLTKKYLNVTLDKDFQTVDWSNDITEPMLNYAATDSLVLLQLHDKLVPLLEKHRLNETAELEFTVLPVVADMELTGIQVNVTKWKLIIEDVKRQLQQAKEELQEEFKDYTINFNSSQQVKQALKKFGITETSVDQKVLQKYVTDLPVIQKYLKYKELSKLLSAFTKSFLEKVDEADSRLHPQYHQLGTETGRFSASNPNLQQVPKNEIRTCFIAGQGKKIIRGDWSQMELRILAEVTQDKRLVEAFRNGEDIHATTAAAVLKKPLDTVTKDERQQAKAMNFGLIYGAGVDTFRRSALNYGVNLTEAEATKLRNGFFTAYPSVRQWQQHQGNKAETCTLGGRLRRWQRKDDPPKYNELLNSPIQGTGADILKRALVNLYQNINGTAKIIGTIHDEILLEVAESEAEAVKEKVEQIMKEAGEYYLKSVPVEVDIAICDTWGG
jgi:P4 family phage/plasmid primase-like protien